MKILKRGVKPEEKMYRGTCSSCSTEFECQQHEGTMTGGGYREDYMRYLSVKCPVCGRQTIAYERNDGQRISPYSASSMAWQMEAGVVER